MPIVLVLFLGTGCGAGDADRDAGIAGPTSTARSGEAGRERSADDRSNIVFVMTDDMKEKMLPRMPVVRSRMMDEGVTFDNAFVTQSLLSLAGDGPAGPVPPQPPHND